MSLMGWLRRKSLPAELVVRSHDWEVGPIIDEEGIDPQWARRRVRCRHCGEERKVWRNIDVQHDPRMREGCR